MTQYNVPITDGLSASQIVLTDANKKLVSAGSISGLVKQSGGSLSAITDNSSNWDTAYGWGDHASAGYQPLISSDVTFYVSTTGSDVTGDGSSGAPWATIGRALEYLGPYAISSTATVTISVADGVYTPSTPYTLIHKFGTRIIITGANSYTKTVSSVYAATGSSGAWSVTLSLNNVTNITTSDYIIITGCSGGTNPTYLNGCHQITNVDSGNNRITILSKHKAAASPSGAVATTSAIVIKTIINGIDGAFHCTTVFGSITKMVCVGDGTDIGVNCINGGSNLTITAPFGVSNYDRGILADYSGAITCESSVVSGCGYIGFLAIRRGAIVNWYSVVSGCTIGYLAHQSGFIYPYLGIPTGCGTGVYSISCSTIIATSVAPSGNTVNYSPALDTVGNQNAFIAS